MQTDQMALKAAIKAAQKVLIKHFKYSEEQHFLITIHNHNQDLFQDGSVDVHKMEQKSNGSE